MKLGRVLAPCCSLALLLSCGPLDQVPVFSARQAFRSAVGNGTSTDAENAVSRKRVSLPAGLTAEVPDAFGEWRAATDADLGLIVHQKGDVPPDAWVYVEAIGNLARVLPTPPFGLFVYTVDVELLDATEIGAVGQRLLGGATQGLFSGLPKSSSAGGTNFLQLATATLGTGVNYASDRGTFSGWKYVGVNHEGLMIRGAHTRGHTAPPDPKKLLKLNATAEGVGGLPPDAQAQLDKLTAPPAVDPSAPGAAAAASIGIRPASMLLVIAEKTMGAGIYMAVVCVEEPTCAVADELVHIVDSLKSGGLASDDATTTIAELSAKIPLRLTPASLLYQLKQSVAPMTKPQPEAAVAEPRRTGTPTPAKPGPSTFFDVPIDKLDDVVFVLDRSGSMEMSFGDLSARLAAAAQALSSTPSSPAAAAGQLQPAADALQQSAAGPAGASAAPSTRMELSRKELLGALEHLPDGKRFDVLYFDEEQELFAPAMATMSPDVRGGAIAFATDVQSGGATAAVDALRAAYALKPKNIVFLSDGMANLGGTPEEMLDEARAQMKAGVKFFTVGLGNGVRADILTALANESGGTTTLR